MSLISFAFKFGDPAGAAAVVDCRFLPNPNNTKISSLTGVHPAVADFFAQSPSTACALGSLFPTLRQFIDDSPHEHIVIGFGCTAGRHRSVFTCERFREFLFTCGNNDVVVSHRDMDEGFFHGSQELASDNCVLFTYDLGQDKVERTARQSKMSPRQTSSMLSSGLEKRRQLLDRRRGQAAII